jgi:hypothetical protein
MAKSKETLSPCVRECRFIRNEPDEKGLNIIYYFQTTEYLGELNITLELDQLFANMDNADLKSYKGNLKFKIPVDRVSNPRFQRLIEVETHKNYIIQYADSPQSLVGDRGGSVSFERVEFLGLFKNWADFYERELKAKNKINFSTPAANVANATNGTPATTRTPASASTT